MTTLLFDLDGTLVDSSHDIIEAFQHSFEQMNVPQPDRQTLISYIGPPLVTTFSQFFDHAEQVDRAVKHFRQHYEDKTIYQNRVYDGIVDTLTTLTGRGYRLFVTTSKHEWIAKDLLEGLGLLPYFTAVYGAVPGRQDKADVITACLQQQNLDRATVAIIGDTKYDIIGGQTVGIKTIGVTWGFGRTEDFISHQADLLIDQPADLLSYFL